MGLEAQLPAEPKVRAAPLRGLPIHRQGASCTLSPLCLGSHPAWSSSASADSRRKHQVGLSVGAESFCLRSSPGPEDLGLNESGVGGGGEVGGAGG